MWEGRVRSSHGIGNAIYKTRVHAVWALVCATAFSFTRLLLTMLLMALDEVTL